jgi:hypothetical protein
MRAGMKSAVDVESTPTTTPKLGITLATYGLTNG